MSKYKCVIFDCDGVLVDSEPLGNQVLIDMANELGANISLEYAYDNFKGNSIYKCIEIIESLIPNDLPADFEREYRRRSFERFEMEMKPISGVEEVIQSLNIPYCVASSGPHNKIRLNLGVTGLLSYFDGKIFSCYDVQKWKPDPAVFYLAAETMNFSPEECVVIEDSPIGVDAALNGGFDVIGFSKYDFKNELKEKKIPTIEAMNELLQIINL